MSYRPLEIVCPLLVSCGLKPVRVDDTMWYRLVVSGIGGKESTLSQSASHADVIQAGGDVAAIAVASGEMPIRLIRQEISSVVDTMICNEVEQEAISRGVKI